MAKYQKKPVVIEAHQLVKGEPWPDGVKWNGRQMYVTTTQRVDVPITYGEWVMPEGDGIHFYPCADEVFQRTYDLVG